MTRQSTLRPRLSYANVTATLALVLALSMGGAYAHGKVGSWHIKDNAVKSRHIGFQHVKSPDIKRGAVSTGKIKARAVTRGKLAPAARSNLLAGGRVWYTGRKDPWSYNFGSWSSQRTGNGTYTITVRAPGLCDSGLLPPVQVTARGVRSGSSSGGSRNCEEGLVYVPVTTRNPNGDRRDSVFDFTVRGPGASTGPAPRAAPRAGGVSDPNR